MFQMTEFQYGIFKRIMHELRIFTWHILLRHFDAFLCSLLIKFGSEHPSFEANVETTDILARKTAARALQRYPSTQMWIPDYPRRCSAIPEPVQCM